MQAAAGVVALIAGDRIDAPRRAVVVGDVARLQALPPAVRTRVAARAVAVISSGGTVTLRRSALARLVRRAVPGLEVASGGTRAITLRYVGPTSRPAGTLCYALDRPVEAGTELRSEMLVQASCPASGGVPLHLDRSSAAVHTRQALSAGTVIGRLALPPPAPIRTGDKLRLSSTSGPVRVARAVVAMQSGRVGGRLFVKGEDGPAFAVPIGRQP